MPLVLQPTPSSRFRFGLEIVAAMLVALIVRPLLYTVITPILYKSDVSSGRVSWWVLYTWILFWEWMPFGVLWWALRRSGRQWLEVGVDWNYFVRHRTAIVMTMLIFIIVAFMLPYLLYQGRVPQSSRSFSFLPVTGLERVFFLVAAISGGICEEICYRGLPLRLFARTTVQAWLALPAAMVAFVFIHGRFGASLPLFYLLCGLLDGGIFIFLGRRHLEWLMVAHALYDGWFILAP
jgi:membrane protease YdiL (CAAX protease family)